MRDLRFPRRDEAVRRLCEAEPALCGGGAAHVARDLFAPARRARAALPAAWPLFWLLLALSQIGRAHV
jgi:hypothetical protein